MFDVLVLLAVAIDEWDYENGGYNDFSKNYKIFSKEIKLNFNPFIGLEFQSDDWLTEPLISVRYNIDRNKFICHVKADQSIPIKIDEFAKSLGELDPSVIDEKVKELRDEESEFIIDYYQSMMGWDIYNPRNEK